MDENKIPQEKIKLGEKQITSGERAVDWMKKEAAPETKEKTANDELVSKELRREIELMNLDESLRVEAQKKAAKIQVLADDDKLKKLLQDAEVHGVVYAVKVAKSMNDPFLLDALHDLLAKGGYYNKFKK